MPHIISDGLGDIIAISGLAVSIFGFIFAIGQILKTKKAAIAASNAAYDAKKVMQKEFMLSDISSSAKSIEELKSLMRRERFEDALFRISDLNSQLIQLRHLDYFQKEEFKKLFQDIIAQLAVLRDILENKISDNGQKIEIVIVNRKLAEIADSLNDLIGKAKYTIKEE